MYLTTIDSSTKIISEQIPCGLLKEYISYDQIMKLLLDSELNLLPSTVSNVRIEKVSKCRVIIYIEPETPSWSFVTYITANEYRSFIKNYHNSTIKLELI